MSRRISSATARLQSGSPMCGPSLLAARLHSHWIRTAAELSASGWSRSIQAEKAYFAETDYNSDNQVKLQADAKKAGMCP